MSWLGFGTSSQKTPGASSAKPGRKSAKNDAFPDLNFSVHDEDFDPDKIKHFDDGDLDDPALLVGSFARDERGLTPDSSSRRGRSLRPHTDEF
jgi:hypothetical protein